MLPTIHHPPIGRDGGSRPNFTEVTVGDLTIWYSYRTPVAFHTPTTGTVVRENDWGPTTGRHLNYIDQGDKKARISGADFVAQIYARTEQIGQ